MEEKGIQKERIRILSTEEDIRLLSDPYRFKILSVIRAKQPITVKQIANEIGDAPAKVHYHVKKFLDKGIIALDHTELIKGIIAKYYVCTADAFTLDVAKGDQQLLSASRMLIESSFKNAKENFIDCMIATDQEDLEEVDQDQDEKRDMFLISGAPLYLTKEEFQQFHDLVDEWKAKRRQKTHGGQEKYFVSIAAVIDTRE